MLPIVQHGVEWARTHFDAIAGWASVLGLVVTVATFLRVRSLSRALRDREMGRSQGELFDTVDALLRERARITNAHRSAVGSLLRQVRRRHTSWWQPWTRDVVRQVEEVEADVSAEVAPDILASKLRMLRARLDDRSSLQ